MQDMFDYIDSIPVEVVLAAVVIGFLLGQLGGRKR
jgi:hypothetical protein